MTARTERPDPWQAVASDLYAALTSLHHRYNDRKGIPYGIDTQVRDALIAYEIEVAKIPNSDG